VRDLLVVVLELRPEQVRAGLADVDRPGELLRDAVVDRGADLVADAAAGLAALTAESLGARLLALAVAVGPGVDADEVAGLLSALTAGGDELAPGWPLPAALPVRAAGSEHWTAAGGDAARPLVAGAVVAVARSVGAHAHLPHP
jgi:hypothetical protein